MDSFSTPITEANALRNLISRLAAVSPSQGLIRLGPAGDGGYLVPDDLEGIEACFSPGVGRTFGFENDCVELGMQAFLADKSVNRPPAADEAFRFVQKYIGATTSTDFMTLDDWVATSLPQSQSDLLLQIDVEGYEYEIFLSMSDRLLKRFRIIVAEFHELPMLWSQPFFQLASRAFDKLLQSHTCVHLHPNNCLGSLVIDDLEIPHLMEFTFLRSDRIEKSTLAKHFPHPLDRDNTGKPPLPLPACWYARDDVPDDKDRVDPTGALR
ncbi:MAG: FkbM family methyltransferase [Chthoniobacterales bacterium]